MRPGFPKSAPFAPHFLEVDGDRQGLLGRAVLCRSCCSTCRSACMTTSSPTRARRKQALDLLVKDWTKVFKEQGKRSLRIAAGHRDQCRRSPRSRASGETGPGCREAMTDMTTIIHPDAAPTASASRPPRRVRRSGVARAVGPGDRLAVHRADHRCCLLAINIFPLIWTIRLSFTSFKLNMSDLPPRFVGLDNYIDILTDEDVWTRLQTTAHFVFWSVALQVLLGFGLALLINRQFRGHSFWTTIILLPMMLSPAVVGNFWTLLFQPQIGPFNYLDQLFHRHRAELVQMIGERRAGAVDDRAGRHLDVDALRDADLPCRAALDSRLHLRGGRGRPRVAVAAVLVDHAADGRCRS